MRFLTQPIDQSRTQLLYPTNPTNSMNPTNPCSHSTNQPINYLTRLFSAPDYVFNSTNSTDSTNSLRITVRGHLDTPVSSTGQALLNTERNKISQGRHRHSGAPWIGVQGRARESRAMVVLRYPSPVTCHRFSTQRTQRTQRTHHPLLVTVFRPWTLDIGLCTIDFA